MPVAAHSPRQLPPPQLLEASTVYCAVGGCLDGKPPRCNSGIVGPVLETRVAVSRNHFLS